VDGEELDFPKELLPGIGRAVEALDAKEVHPVIEISIGNTGVLQLSATGPYLTFKERYKIAFKKPVAFNVNPDLLADALGMASTAIVSNTRIRMASADAGFVHVVGLIVKRVEAASEEQPGEQPQAPVKAVAPKTKKAAPKTAAVPEDAW
jgi:hypothetical protein